MAKKDKISESFEKLEDLTKDLGIKEKKISSNIKKAKKVDVKKINKKEKVIEKKKEILNKEFSVLKSLEPEITENPRSKYHVKKHKNLSESVKKDSSKIEEVYNKVDRLKNQVKYEEKLRKL